MSTVTTLTAAALFVSVPFSAGSLPSPMSGSSSTAAADRVDERGEVFLRAADRWSTAAMKIASFNIQKFGRNKVSDPEVLQILVQIISRYDIILILEVVDISGRSVETLMDALNTSDTAHHYTLKISCRLGRSRYKEQFMFLYRDDLVDLVGSYQFDDQVTDGGDVFARDPYILRFRCHNTVLKDLVMIPVHTKPEDSETELDELYDVFQHMKRKWRTDNVMILGDFNADGSYVSDRDMLNIRIRSDKNFHWLIGDDVDTTDRGVRRRHAQRRRARLRQTLQLPEGVLPQQRAGTEGQRPLPRRGGAQVSDQTTTGNSRPTVGWRAAGAEERKPAAGEGEAQPGDPNPAHETVQDDARRRRGKPTEASQLYCELSPSHQHGIPISMCFNWCPPHKSVKKNVP
ncbi:deoxyribonuclease-1-like isoform X2 [Nerophis lumbriciformis]|uniref:deoxyribonuclease-1-like isoform X2 n=1 Tax=Nerophis lumbriciformis TaxID=546530 RepID=UPI002AE0566B|nr:deoxyribonuclease-1-like isoform X2 [Nerophis lumbriciformis]